MTERRQELVRSLSRGLDLLEAVAQYEEIGLVELAERCGLQNSTAHRLLATLVARQYVQTNPGGKYGVGQKVVELATKAQEQTARIRALARPHLEELRDRTGECVDLVQLDALSVTTIEQVRGSSAVAVFSERRRVVPAYATSAGKIMLAHGGMQLTARFRRAEPFAHLTPNTPRTTDELLKQVPHILQMGYALGDEELEEGVLDVAALVTRPQSDLQLALVLSGPAVRMRRHGIEETGRLVHQKSRLISEALAQDSSHGDVDLMTRAVSLAVDHELSEVEISQSLGISRPRTGRLLSHARELGIIDLPRNVQLERELLTKFSHYGLTETFVLSTENLSDEYVVPLLGRLAAKHVQLHLTNEAIVGVSWGTAVHATVQAIQMHKSRATTIVQILGAVGSTDPRIDGPDLAREFAERVGGTYVYIHAPLIVDNAYVRDTLMSDRRTRDALDLGRRAQLAVVGIGSIDPSVSCLTRAGFISPPELAEIAAEGSVGDFCGYQLDEMGRVMSIPVNDRVIALPVDELRAIPSVIAVASGVVKAPTVVAALRGRFIRVLVLTDVLAERTVSLPDGRSPTLEAVTQMGSPERVEVD